MTGTIKTLNLEKGYGFIVDQRGTEFFFHRSGLRQRDVFDTLRSGVKVQFASVDSPKGPRAEDVTLEP